MDISAINNISAINGLVNNTSAGTAPVNRNEAFEKLYQSALGMVNDTNSLTNAAKEEEMKYALGISDNVHDLQQAQSKANTSLQYTVAVRNKVIEAYKEIMNLQF